MGIHKTVYLIVSLLLSLSIFASDHIDGPVTTKHKVGDLTDLFAFPTPNKAGHLTVILNAYPVVGDHGHFSSKVDYRIIIKEAAVGQDGFELSRKIVVTCKFMTPRYHSHHHPHAAICRTSNGLRAKSSFNQIGGQSTRDDFKLFNGRRSDPFFFNAAWANDVSNNGKIPMAKNSNIMNRINVLSVALEFKVSDLFDELSTSLFAISAESVTRDHHHPNGKILDRVGRPEVTNVSMVTHKGKTELRDMFNGERSFDIGQYNAKLYTQRLNENIAYYDKIDGTINWDNADKNRLVEVLVNDYLVVDLSKPCKSDAFFEIEKSLLSGRSHSTCGGRKLTDDIMDTLFTLYINADSGKKIRDGVDRPFKAPHLFFPYVASPSTGVQSWGKTQLAKIGLYLASLF